VEEEGEDEGGDGGVCGISRDKYFDEFDVVMDSNFCYGGDLVEFEEDFEEDVSGFFFHFAEEIETAY
jgi:hypothetical protein